MAQEAETDLNLTPEEREARKRRLGARVAAGLGVSASVAAIVTLFFGDGIFAASKPVNIANVDEIAKKLGGTVAEGPKSGQAATAKPNDVTITTARSIIEAKYQELEEGLRRGNFQRYLDFFSEDCYWVSPDNVNVTKSTFRDHLSDFAPGNTQLMQVSIKPSWASLIKLSPDKYGPNQFEVKCYRKVKYTLQSGLYSELQEDCRDIWKVSEGEAAVVAVYDIKDRTVRLLEGTRYDGADPMR